ncbi:hypothetical protein DPX16_10533 [Anabarilius grahami]|uniref:Uncharacterized protein n=1 Tax=Anabarilius grahami TaxID=495550 RepID=A0A3N0Z6L8_ANAGA|nr:hypothetical protein DPX16_10533 [Anabarilius grahami]
MLVQISWQSIKPPAGAAVSLQHLESWLMGRVVSYTFWEEPQLSHDGMSVCLSSSHGRSSRLAAVAAHTRPHTHVAFPPAHFLYPQARQRPAQGRSDRELPTPFPVSPSGDDRRVIRPNGHLGSIKDGLCYFPLHQQRLSSCVQCTAASGCDRWHSPQNGARLKIRKCRRLHGKQARTPAALPAQQLLQTSAPDPATNSSGSPETPPDRPVLFTTTPVCLLPSISRSKMTGS